MSSFKRGSIILATVKDTQGKNPKARPLVILTPTESISTDPESTVTAVAISRDIDNLPNELKVPLPWKNEGHPRTGLKYQSGAVCSWLVEIQFKDIARELGTVPPALMLQILTKVRAQQAAEYETESSEGPTNEVG